MRFLAILPFFLLACTVSGPERTPAIRPGLYEHSENFLYDGQFYTIMQQVDLNSDRTYYREGFLNAVKLVETKGKWKVNAPVLTTYEILSRSLNDAGGFGPWESVQDQTTSIQGITASSFQILMQAEDIPIGVVGVQPGWKTYNRIGD